MLLDGLLQLLDTLFELADIFLRDKGQLDFLEIFLRDLKLSQQVLDLLTLFLQGLIRLDVLVFELSDLLLVEL